jgi:uncharacterized membrane protein
MKPETEEKVIYSVFEWVLVLKIFNAVWETVLGSIILFDRRLKDTIFLAIENELHEHPDNFFASHIEHLFQNINHNTEILIGSYILAQGLLKILLIIGLLKKQLWAYPTTIYIFFAFVFYQIFRYNHTHSPVLVILTVLDIFTILLIEHEYKILKKKD